MNTFNKRNRSANRVGASAVEAALLLPVLLIISFGSLDLAQYINSGQLVSNASREAMRVACRNTTSNTTEVESVFKDYLLACMPGMTKDELDEYVTINIQEVVFAVSDDDNSGSGDSSTGGGTSGNGKGKGKGKGGGQNTSDNTGGQTSDNSTSTSTSSEGRTYRSIPNGDLSSLESGSAISVEITFDFEAVRWLDGFDFDEQSIESFARRE